MGVHEEDGPAQEVPLHLVGELLQAEFENDVTGFGRTPCPQHLKGDDGLVKVEPSVGALLKPAESDGSSLVPTKPVRNLNFVAEEDETSLLAWWRWSTSSGSTSTLST